MDKNMNISLDIALLKHFIDDKVLNAMQLKVDKVIDSIHNGTCLGNDYLGWVDLPFNVNAAELDSILKIAGEIKSNDGYLICIGIGGSYLGARATIDFLASPFKDNRIFYLGHQLSSDYVSGLMEHIAGINIYVNVISKSGTTTEPGIAFRILLDKMRALFPDSNDLRQRIIATTDKQKGALRELVDSEGFRPFVIPDDVGGRFSVLTPVGLLPIAAMGYDIKALLEGARSMAQLCRDNTSVLENPVLTYAVSRYLLYQHGKKVEVLSAFDPALQYVGEWWKQLYGESEGKDGLGIFPASTLFTTDLHSMGQYIQDGERMLFETFINIAQTKKSVDIPETKDNKDGMNYLTGMNLAEVNYQAYRGTALAHYSGGVPNMTITMPERNEYYLGQLFYFFEYAVAVSGLLLGINPFNQPGVEDYKKNMFALLGKPGYEELRKKLSSE